MTNTHFILGIESSCDETAAAIVSNGRDVLSSVVLSQASEHASWGGVVPEIAGRGHLRDIIPAINRCFTEAGIQPSHLSGIAVTSEPGLLGSLLIGTTAAKALSWSWEKPLIPVHHIEAHAYAALMSEKKWVFPYITLIASGGHTAIYQSNSPTEHKILGATRDDAAGEALDKAAAMLELSYPGGPAIEKAGKQGDPKAYSFKRPLLEPQSLDFSFSGLKTALLYKLKGPGGKKADPTLKKSNNVPGMAASFESAVMDTLTEKCLRACKKHGIPRILVGGGVARNKRLRRILTKKSNEFGLTATFAKPEHCTDNAVMIAGLGHALWNAGKIASLDFQVAPNG